MNRRVVVFVIAIATVSIRSSSQSTSSAGGTSDSVLQIDGATNPDAIPDALAYEQFFRVLARNPDSVPSRDDDRRKSYMHYFFRTSCGAEGTDDRSLSEEQGQKLLSLADRTTQSLITLSKSERSDFGQQRDELISAAIRSLPDWIDPDAAEKVRRHVSEHVKRHITMQTVRMPAVK